MHAFHNKVEFGLPFVFAHEEVGASGVRFFDGDSQNGLQNERDQVSSSVYGVGVIRTRFSWRKGVPFGAVVVMRAIQFPASARVMSAS